MGIFVFTPYGKGEVMGTRNDGIVIVQLRTSQDKPYVGYFHLTQVRQMDSEANEGMKRSVGLMTLDNDMLQSHTSLAGGAGGGEGGKKSKRGMEEREVLGGIPFQAQRGRCCERPFADMTNIE